MQRVPEGSGKSTAREYFESICVAVILALFVRTFVVQAFKIPSGSMENNLLIGDHLLANKVIFAPAASWFERALLPTAPIRRGDVLVFKFPEDPEVDYIKRVIGLPGDVVELRNTQVFINGQALVEPYARYALGDVTPGSPDYADLDVRRKYGPETVPPDHYFMMGDNRDNSQDSRYWGFLPRSHVKGKALFVYFSFGDPAQGIVGGVRWGRVLHQIH